MASRPVLVAVDRFETGGRGYAPGDLITDTTQWPVGALQTRLDRGSVQYTMVETPDEPVVETPDEPVVTKTTRTRTR